MRALEVDLEVSIFKARVVFERRQVVLSVFKRECSSLLVIARKKLLHVVWSELVDIWHLAEVRVLDKVRDRECYGRRGKCIVDDLPFHTGGNLERKRLIARVDYIDRERLCLCSTRVRRVVDQKRAKDEVVRSDQIYLISFKHGE